MSSSSAHAKKPNLSLRTNSPVDQISFLQQTVGNRQVQRLLGSGVIQTKLRVNQSGDSYEQEADRISGQVLATPAFSGKSGARQIRRDAGQSGGEEIAAPASVQHALVSPGDSLEPSLRREMEQRFGHDFSAVRVHLGATAEQSARDVNARAYTVRNKMVFGAGEFSPGTREGRRLLAHELTHVVQQSGTDANVVRRSNGFDDDEPTLVEGSSSRGQPRGHVERGGEKRPGNIASGEIDTSKPRGPSGGGGSGTGGGGGSTSKSAGKAGKAGGTVTRTLRSVAELGKVGAVDAAFLYLQLHAAHFEALEQVSKRVEIANNLLNHVEEFEKGARALRGAVSELQSAESALPGEPLATDEEAPSVSVSLGELEYIDAYATSAGNIISKAFDARVKLNKIIEGWDTVVAQSSATRDFTRKAVMEATQILDLRFSKETGGSFRGFLIDARDDAGRVEGWARSKWGYAKDILDTANLPLRRAIDKLGAIRNELMTIARGERPSAGVLVAIDYLKAAQESSDASVALEAVKSSLSVLQSSSGVGNLRLRLAFLKGKLEALVGH
jgi:Domain of unknown function (DUF4157)